MIYWARGQIVMTCFFRTPRLWGIGLLLLIAKPIKFSSKNISVRVFVKAIVPNSGKYGTTYRTDMIEMVVSIR